MKKLIVLMAMVLAFSFTAVAQYSSSEMNQNDQATTSKSKKSGEMGTSGKMGKESSITGCLSKEADANGMYTLTNGHYKKGVEVGPTDKVKEHAGHEVKLTGTWSGSGAQKTFEVASMKHISETCSMGGKSMGKKDSMKKDEMKH